MFVLMPFVPNATPICAMRIRPSLVLLVLSAICFYSHCWFFVHNTQRHKMLRIHCDWTQRINQYNRKTGGFTRSLADFLNSNHLQLKLTGYADFRCAFLQRSSIRPNYFAVLSLTALILLSLLCLVIALESAIVMSLFGFQDEHQVNA